MRSIVILVILTLYVNNLNSLSIRKHGNKYNSIPSDEIDLWFSDHLPETPKIIETLTSSFLPSSVSSVSTSFSSSSSSSPPSASSSSSKSSVTYDDEDDISGNREVKVDENKEGLMVSKSFSSSSSSSSSSPSNESARPVVTLKNTSEPIPFTKVDATLKIDGHKEMDKVEEGVGPAVSFDYDSEYAESEISPQSSSPYVGPSDDNHFETGDLKIEISDLKPVYIKPPSGFKPVLYPNREMDGIHPMASAFADDFSPSPTNLRPKVTLEPPKEPYPYPYPFGLTSWTLGGIRGIQRGGFWESMGSDAALGLPMRPFKGNPVSVVEWINLDGSTSKDNLNGNYQPPLPPPLSPPPSSVFSSFDSSAQEFGSSSSSSNKLPLSSWMFGGLRQFSPFTWQMPPMVIEKVEYVPLSSSSSSPPSQPESISSSSSHRSKSPSNINSYWIISNNEPSPVE